MSRKIYLICRGDEYLQKNSHKFTKNIEKARIYTAIHHAKTTLNQISKKIKYKESDLFSLLVAYSPEMSIKGFELVPDKDSSMSVKVDIAPDSNKIVHITFMFGVK